MAQGTTQTYTPPRQAKVRAQALGWVPHEWCWVLAVSLLISPSSHGLWLSVPSPGVPVLCGMPTLAHCTAMSLPAPTWDC